MKHLKYIIWILLILFLQILNVSALCTYKEQASLNDLVSKVKVFYEINEKQEYEDMIPQTEVTNDNEDDIIDENGEIFEETIYENVPVTNYLINLNVTNIVDNIYINIKNLTDNTSQNYYYSNTDKGQLTILIENSMQINKFEIRVYSNLDNCKSELLKIIDFVTPKYNEISEYDMCVGSSYYYCQQFVDKDLSEEEIIEKVNADNLEKQKENNTIIEEQSTPKEKNLYKTYFIIGLSAGALIIIISIILIIAKKRRGHKL